MSMLKWTLFIAAGFVLVIVVVASAYAQVEVERPVSPNDWSPIINQLIGVGMIIATGVLSWMGMAIRSYFASKGILAVEQTKDAKQMFFNQAALLALGLYETMKKISMGNGGTIDWTKIDPADPFLREAAEWMIQAWPEATEGMSIADVMKSLLARVPSGQMTEKALELAKAKAAGTAPVLA